ncbi:MAG: GMC family oxidoreductase N-terminal domain-containing protein [Bradymonadaceae bacterium]
MERWFRNNGSTAETIARAMIPGGGAIKPAGRETVDAAREIIARSVGKFGPRAFDLLAEAVEWGTVAQTGRRFSQHSPPEQEDILHRYARNQWTRWPFLVFAGLLKTAHFDNAEHFEAFDVIYDRAGKPEPARWMRQVHGPDDVEDGQEIECDVVVIGTGAGGAVVGAKLAKEGYAVVFVEEGLFHRRDDFEGRAIPAHRRFFRHRMVALGNTLIPVQMGKMVGGSTAINTATCFRTPPQVLDQWCETMGANDLCPEEMERHFEEVETKVQVRSPPLAAGGKAAMIFGRGCEELNWQYGPMRRNVTACTGEGVCDFGCPTDARQSTDISYIPSALREGAVVFCGARAERVLIEGGSAAGIESVTATNRRFRIRARATVLACGSVPTPAFLLHQGIANSSGQVGRNLSLHPASGAAGLFGESVRGFDSVPQSYFSDQFFKDDGYLLAGAQLPIDVGGALLPIYGRAYADAASRIDQLVGSTIIVHDTDRVGRVRALPDGGPLITYRMARRDTEKLRAGMIRLAEIYFAAGAERVYPLMPRMPVLDSPADIDKLRHMKVRANDFITTSWHPLGTCQIGTNPSSSVVDLNHETHDVRRLFIVDGSILPGPTGLNPQLTIMALANRAAERIAERLAS